MFKLNFKIALRNLWKNKTSSLINISGLAIGLTSCLLLLLYVSYQWNYDKQGKDNASVYQVLMNFEGLDGKVGGTSYMTPNILAPVLKQDYPGIIAVSRTDYGDPKLIAAGLRSFKKKARFADADMLKMFDYDFIAGNPQTALNAPYNIILTESTAKLLFGTADVLNRSVKFENRAELKVTGVVKDLPENTSVKFDYLMPWSLHEAIDPGVKSPEWTDNSWITLVKLSPSADAARINEMISGLTKKNAKDARAFPFLFPFSKLHLYGTFINGKSTGGDIEQVRLFMGLAIGVLLIACINFMNMATAKSEKRAKEVGIKKTIGATRGSLITQFLVESLVSALCSAVMAIVLVEIGLPLFNNLLGIKMEVAYSNPYLWLSLTGIIVFTGIIAGSYPAFYLSSFNPLQALRKKSPGRNWTNFSLRQVLVVVQFSFAVVLIIGTTVVYQQIRYIRNRPIGYQVSQLVEIPQDGELAGKFELLRERLLKSDAVAAVCQLSGSMANYNSDFWGLEWPGSTEEDRHTVFYQLGTTYDFVKTTGVKLLQGRDFSRRFASDSVAVMLNATAVKRMNLVHPIGQIVKYQGRNCTVVGVFEDFIWGSPYERGLPMIVSNNQQRNGYITVRLNPAHTGADNMNAIAKIVKEINPAYPSDITFVDQLYAEKLKAQKVLGILSNLFGGLAIFISCLGLFGLAAYSAEQRTKEIGVRKVLGASVSSLMRLLSFSFLKMVVIAIVIAVPLASYLMSGWLKKFEFHTSVSWGIILLSAAGTIGIALVTVSFQAYKAAKANPISALKYE